MGYAPMSQVIIHMYICYQNPWSFTRLRKNMTCFMLPVHSVFHNEFYDNSWKAIGQQAWKYVQGRRSCSAPRNEFLPFSEIEINMRLVSVTLQVQRDGDTDWSHRAIGGPLTEIGALGTQTRGICSVTQQRICLQVSMCLKKYYREELPSHSQG